MKVIVKDKYFCNAFSFAFPVLCLISDCAESRDAGGSNFVTEQLRRVWR